MKCETEAGQRERVEVIFFVRLVVVEHLQHHLNFSVDVKFSAPDNAILSSGEAE